LPACNGPTINEDMEIAAGLNVEDDGFTLVKNPPAAAAAAAGSIASYSSSSSNKRQANYDERLARQVQQEWEREQQQHQQYQQQEQEEDLKPASKPVSKPACPLSPPAPSPRSDDDAYVEGYEHCLSSMAELSRQACDEEEDEDLQAEERKIFKCAKCGGPFPGHWGKLSSVRKISQKLVDDLSLVPLWVLVAQCRWLIMPNIPCSCLVHCRILQKTNPPSNQTWHWYILQRRP
jgi:hypothetical protein